MVKKVGYASPPLHSQWQKGQSGNPKGRKKGSVNMTTDLLAELGEVIPIVEGGKPRRITKQRALVKSLVAKAIKGDARAANAVIGLAAKLLGIGEQPEADLTPAERAALDDVLHRRAALLAATITTGGDDE